MAIAYLRSCRQWPWRPRSGRRCREANGAVPIASWPVRSRPPCGLGSWAWSIPGTYPSWSYSPGWLLLLAKYADTVAHCGALSARAWSSASGSAAARDRPLCSLLHAHLESQARGIGVSLSNNPARDIGATVRSCGVGLIALDMAINRRSHPGPAGAPPHPGYLVWLGILLLPVGSRAAGRAARGGFCSKAVACLPARPLDHIWSLSVDPGDPGRPLSIPGCETNTQTPRTDRPDATILARLLALCGPGPASTASEFLYLQRPVRHAHEQPCSRSTTRHGDCWLQPGFSAWLSLAWKQRNVLPSYRSGQRLVLCQHWPIRSPPPIHTGARATNRPQRWMVTAYLRTVDMPDQAAALRLAR